MVEMKMIDSYGIFKQKSFRPKKNGGQKWEKISTN